MVPPADDAAAARRRERPGRLRWPSRPGLACTSNPRRPYGRLAYSLRIWMQPCLECRALCAASRAKVRQTEIVNVVVPDIHIIGHADRGRIPVRLEYWADICCLVCGARRRCHSCATRGNHRAEIRGQAMLRKIEAAWSLRERIEAALSGREWWLAIPPTGVDHLRLRCVANGRRSSFAPAGRRR